MAMKTALDSIKYASDLVGDIDEYCKRLNTTIKVMQRVLTGPPVSNTHMGTLLQATKQLRKEKDEIESWSLKFGVGSIKGS